MSEAERTEAPTPKRLRDAARDGDLPQSRDLSAALVMGGGTLMLMLLGPAMTAMLMHLLATGLRIAPGEDPGARLMELFAKGALALAPLAAGTCVCALAGPFLIGAWGFRPAAIRPKWSRMDPAQGIRRLLGFQAVGELGKSIAKLVFAGTALAAALWAGRDRLAGLALADPRIGAAALGAVVGQVLVLGSVLLGAIALVDAPWQVTRRRKRLAMTRDELRRESRESDGAPELRRARRERQYALATLSARRAMQDATVVLTNPTQFAVALRYRTDMDAVPIVVARGVDESAAAIRDLARGNNVPLLEYPALARALYFTAKTGDAVREDLYLAVATVLAFVMNLDAMVAGGRLPPVIEVPEAARFGADGRRSA